MEQAHKTTQYLIDIESSILHLASTMVIPCLGVTQCILATIHFYGHIGFILPGLMLLFFCCLGFLQWRNWHQTGSERILISQDGSSKNLTKNLVSQVCQRSFSCQYFVWLRLKHFDSAHWQIIFKDSVDAQSFCRLRRIVKRQHKIQK